jgi:hypothetical protein
MRGLPDFDTLLKNFPNPADDADTVKSTIGGSVDAAWITNTCAIRMSRTLNYSGIPLPPKFTGLNVVAGADGKWYAYRQRELRRWMQLNFGQPMLRHKPSTGQISRADFSLGKGIIGFDIHFSNATGHVDLWDGTSYTHEAVDADDYFALATTVVLWIPVDVISGAG